MIFYEDMTPGEGQLGPSGTVDRDELVSFAHDWDPMQGLDFHESSIRGRRCGICLKTQSPRGNGDLG